jgi:nucleoside-diphosphate-sugar epimerase
MTVFLTGASGFIGRHVLSALLAGGHKVRALVRDLLRADFAPHPHLLVLPGEMNTVRSSDLAGCDALIHLAAHGVVNGMNDWEACFRVNVTDSLALWLRAADAGVTRFVICGSCFEYGRSAERYDFIPVDAPLEPTGAYHASKAAATMAAFGFAINYKIKLAVLRPFHVYGDGEAPTRFWPALRSAALACDDFSMTSGEQIRDFTPVEQVARLVMHWIVNLELKSGSPVITNIGSGHPQTLRSFAENCWRKFGARGMLKVGAIPMRSNEVMRYVPLI